LNFLDSLSRNSLWVPSETQLAIARSRLIVVGCGGTGLSFVVNAAHLGFRDFALCDADLLDVSNLNRYFVATLADVSRPKVDILYNYLITRWPETKVERVTENFPNTSIMKLISDASIVIGCMDDPYSRIQLDAVCRHYDKTLIDLGTGFKTDVTSGAVIAAGGQVLISHQNGPCLMCLGFRPEMFNGNYFVPGHSAPEPSSILLNQIIGALAVEYLLSFISGDHIDHTGTLYDREEKRLYKIHAPLDLTCRLCGNNAHEHVKSIGKPIFL
jgi:molybdopterin/thiamine biosynthesis adenylyltransferase